MTQNYTRAKDKINWSIRNCSVFDLTLVMANGYWLVLTLHFLWPPEPTFTLQRFPLVYDLLGAATTHHLVIEFRFRPASAGLHHHSLGSLHHHFYL